MATSYFDGELQEVLTKLSHEFETFGLPSLQNLESCSKFMLLQLIDNIYSLIQMYRKLINDKNESTFSITQLKKENKALINNEEFITTELSLKLNEIALMHEKNSLKGKNLTAITEDKQKLVNEINTLKKMFQTKESNYQCRLRQLIMEKEELQEQARDTVGTYVCRDKQIITVLNKYKLKEGIYKETIKTLEENNRVILEDVLNLREMIFASITK